MFRQRYGREPGPGELDSLTLSTRGSKSTLPRIDVNAAWRALGEEHGQSRKRSEGLFNDRNIERQPKVDLAGELLSEVTRERSMITERELRAKAYELSASACRPAQADRLVNELARSGELVRLEGGMWTTRSLRETEQMTVDIAERRATENAAPVNERSLKQARREIGKEIHGSLTQEQRDALQTITGPGGIAVLVGRAGTGKGVTISAAARAWQLEDKEVIGTAIAGATAKRLQADAKLDRAMTTDSLLNQVEKGHIRLDRDTVVIMDEAGMADSDRFSRLVKVTAERESKLLVVGDAAQINSIGAGGLFKEIEGRAPTAELTEVHRARHEWERKAWEQIRDGEPGPALAQYHAHDRLHIHDTRAEAAEAMVENWDETRRSLPDGRQAVMITDASNKERDQINAMAQERRAQAGELGSHRVELPDKPYGLASGDEVIFTAQYRVPGEKRVENGITGTVLDNTARGEDRVTIKTTEREPREVVLDTSKFSDLSLAYAVHVHKAQGLTAETSGILTGAWQTDKEHAYVAVSRAREQTQIYLAREDLGEQGMDTGAIERLAERMQRSRAQEATIAKEAAGQTPDRQRTAERGPQHQHTTERTGPREHESDDILDTQRRRPHDRHDDDLISPGEPDRAHRTRVEQDAREHIAQHEHETKDAPVNIKDANPQDIHLDTRDLGDIQLAYSGQLYDLQAHTGEPTYVLFGGWQTEEQLGFVTAVHSHGDTNVSMSTEDRNGRDIHAELTDRIGQVIERSQSQEASATTREASTPEPDRERQPGQPAQAELGDRTPDQQPAIEPLRQDPNNEQAIEPSERDPQLQPERGPVERDPYIEQAIQAAQERQQAWEQGIEQERENDRGFGIE